MWVESSIGNYYSLYDHLLERGMGNTLFMLQELEKPMIYSI